MAVANISEKYPDYTREMLVEEYLETRLASFVEVCGIDRRWMSKDVSKDIIPEAKVYLEERGCFDYTISSDDCDGVSIKYWYPNIILRWKD